MKIFIRGIVIILAAISLKVSAQDENLVISDIKEINSNCDDFSPLFLDSATMIFTSSRRNIKTEKVMAKHHNIYVSKMDSSKWSGPKILSYQTNSDNHESSVGISNDKKTLYIYKTYNGGDIYFSTIKDDGKWTSPKRMKFNTQYHECSACRYNNTVYFVSDKPGGKGKLDIYKTTLNEDGKWSEPENMEALNTELNENHLFISQDGKTLYFSSEGNGSLGKYDIFKSDIEDNVLTKPENLGSFINSEYNDISFTQDLKGKIYFASDRPNDSSEVYNIYEYIEVPVIRYVPLVLSGESPMEKDSTAEINLIIDSVRVECLMRYLPEKIEVDKAEVEDTTKILSYEDLKLGQNVKLAEPENKPLIEIKPLLTLEEVKAQVNDINYCMVQVGAFSKITSVEMFTKSFPLLAGKVKMIKEENLNRFVIKETFNDIDSAAEYQKKCLKEYHSVPDTFIGVYNNKGERFMIYFDVEKDKYMLLKPEQQTNDGL